MIACDCAVCTSTDPRNRRTRQSIHVIGVAVREDKKIDPRHAFLDAPHAKL